MKLAIALFLGIVATMVLCVWALLNVGWPGP